MPATITYRDSRGLRAAVRPKVDHILGRFPAIPNVWTSGASPDHNNLKCCDYMVFSNRTLGDAVVEHHIRNAERLGVRLIIWYGRIWRTYTKVHSDGRTVKPRTWDKYTQPNQHTDHPHVEYIDAPMGTILEDRPPKPRNTFELARYPYATVIDFTYLSPLAQWDAPYISPDYAKSGARTPVEATRRQVWTSLGPNGLKLHNLSQADFNKAANFRKVWARWQHACYGGEHDGIPGHDSARKFATRVGLRFRI